MSREIKKIGSQGIARGVQEKSRRTQQFSLGRVLVLIAIFIVVFIFCTLWAQRALPGEFYWFPRTSADWTGWATALGSFGTAGALVYAARKFALDAHEQRELRRDRDMEARNDGKVLGVRVSRMYPGDWPVPVTGLTIKLTNNGSEELSNLQVKIPDFPAKIISAQTAPIPPDLNPGYPEFGMEDEDWSSDVVPFSPTDCQQVWLCGQLPPQTILKLGVKFDPALTGDDALEWVEERSGDLKGRIAVIFNDHADRTWIRSTEGKRPLQRLWPESFIEETLPLPQARHCLGK